MSFLMYSAVAVACKHIIGKGIAEINNNLTFEEYELICGAVNVGTDKFLEPRKAGTVSSDGR